jgi:hypothetical protein
VIEDTRKYPKDPISDLWKDIVAAQQKFFGSPHVTGATHWFPNFKARNLARLVCFGSTNARQPLPATFCECQLSMHVVVLKNVAMFPLFLEYRVRLAPIGYLENGAPLRFKNGTYPLLRHSDEGTPLAVNSLVR